jgi:acetyl-CoA carboxylase carboxyltransferase component
MKTTTILLAVSLFSNLSNAQVLNEEMIVGLWKSGNQKVMVKIDRLGSIYQGRIIWLSDSGGGQRTDRRSQPCRAASKHATYRQQDYSKDVLQCR